jgi:hypothetical protein
MVSKEVSLKLTTEQAGALRRLLYDHGHWESELLFPIQNTLMDALDIDDQTLEANREEKDKGVAKLFRLYSKGGPQALAEALELGVPAAIKMDALAWQDLEAIWYHLSLGSQTSGRSDQPAKEKGMMSDNINRPTPVAKRNLVVLAEIVVLDVGEDPEPTLTALEAEFLDTHRGGFAVIGYQVEEQVGPPAEPDAYQQFVTRETVLDVSQEYLLSWMGEAQPDDQVAAEPPKPEGWQKPFLIASVCRADLRGILTAEEIASLSNGDMEDIADRMSDAYRDSGGYWESLAIMAQLVLKRKEEALE